MKVELAMAVNEILRKRELSRARAARALGILQPQVSDLVRYRPNRFSVARLIQFLTPYRRHRSGISAR